MSHLYRLVLLAALIAAIPTSAQDNKWNEGGDLAFGGKGSEPGKFLELRDIAFDAHGDLYALDGARLDKKTKEVVGNLRVQKFSPSGKLLTTIDLRDEATGAKLGDKNDPQRVAADIKGNVYVTQPAAGVVQQFGADGKLVRSIPVPAAMAVCTMGTGDSERIAVVASATNRLKGKIEIVGGVRIELLKPDGTVEKSIKFGIEKPLETVLDITADKDGNFYVHAAPHAVYVFSPEGKLTRTLGGNDTKTRNPDGSELLHTVTVDSKGNVYTYAWGNPGLVTRFDADGKWVTQRGGQFKFADPWSTHSGYAILAVDPSDRLWVGIAHLSSSDKYRDAPCVVRTAVDFLEKPTSVKRTPVDAIGFVPILTCGLPFNVTYEAGKPVAMEYTVAAGRRTFSALTVEWQAFDALKNLVGSGTFEMTLTNGEAAKKGFAFTPQRYGAYFVLARAKSGGIELGALGEHVGVTPAANMPPLREADSKGGWTDAARQMWAGLPLMRLHPGAAPDKLDKFDEELKAAEAHGATVLVQLVDNLKNYKADTARAVLERFKGRIKYLEVCNEPNFSGTVEDYFKVHKEVYVLAKSIDKTVQVMGPATVNMNLEWMAKLYELGFKDVSDVVSLHDYEGHESITPEHWRWKFAELRKIMAKYNDDKKPIWQTERAISGVRAGHYMGLVQAIRTTLHRDLLETLGVPAEHNSHYYLNQGGYSSVPSYVWSKNGPHPAALALRTRHALTTATGHAYADSLDFGPTGNTFFQGLRFAGKDNDTVILRNLGTRPTPVAFKVEGAAALAVTDAWGNAKIALAADGKLVLRLDQLPIYVTVPKGAKLVPSVIDFGPNLAGKATFTYSSTFKGEMAQLNNGVLETYHNANPNGDTKGKLIWAGDLAETPQTLGIAFEKPTTVQRVVLRGVRPDNTFGTLLDYDLEAKVDDVWKLIETVKRPMPPSEKVTTADSVGAAWVDDTNFFVHEFAPLTVTELRLLVRSATHGLLPDNRVRSAPAPKVMLREIEIHGAK
jgi:hypothetical protein